MILYLHICHSHFKWKVWHVSHLVSGGELDRDLCRCDSADVGDRLLLLVLFFRILKVEAVEKERERDAQRDFSESLAKADPDSAQEW